MFSWGFSYFYEVDDSIFNFRNVGWHFSFLFLFNLLNEPRREKTVFGVSDQVDTKSGFTAIEDG